MRALGNAFPVPMVATILRHLLVPVLHLPAPAVIGQEGRARFWFIGPGNHTVAQPLVNIGPWPKTPAREAAVPARPTGQTAPPRLRICRNSEPRFAEARPALGSALWKALKFCRF
eukprot:7333320-Alexandrium_andersonii.AAC.1